MPKYTKKQREHIGLSPYALVFRGQRRLEKISINALGYDETQVTEMELKSEKDIKKFLETKGTHWINIYGVHDANSMEELSKTLKVPENVFSDIMNPSLRPKIEEFENGLFLTLKMLRYPENRKDADLTADNLSILIMDDQIISFQEQPAKAFDAVRDRIRRYNTTKIRTAGPDYLAFALLDVVVDNYIYIIGLIGDKIESLEDRISPDAKNDILDEINDYKSEMNFIRKNIKPAREMMLNLVKLDSDFLQPQNRVHFKELQNNITEATESAESYREILYDQLNIYHTMMSTKLNDIMRILTVFSVIFIPLTFIVGVYGTNFINLPEIHWKYGYFAMWILMVLVALIMLWYFKRKKWF